MAEITSAEETRDVRALGFGRIVRPSLEQIHRRRSEVLGITIFGILAVSIGIALLSFAPTGLLEQIGGGVMLVRGALVLLGLAFVVYLVDKERRLRRLTKALMNERVVSTALMNQLRDVSLLAEAGRAVTSAMDLPRTLGVVLSSAAELLGADEGTILLLDGDDMVVAAGFGRTRVLLNDRRPRTEGVAGYVARSGQAVLIDGELERTELAALIDAPQGRDISVLSSLCVPLEVMGEVLGVLSLNVTGGDRRFEEHDRHTLELFAHHAAIAVYQERALTNEGSRTSAAALDRMRADMVGRIAGDVDRLSIEPRERRGPKRPGSRVLAVDDDAAILRTLEIALEADGFEVLLASDGQTAIDRIASEDPDVILLDLAIPLTDGWRVLEKVQELDRPRVICITAKSGRRDRMRAWMLGADEYLLKPFEVDSLPGLIESVLSRTGEERADRREEALRELFAAG